MRDRLKKLILENDILCHTCGENTDSYCAEYLADRLIENGVIVPPCKVGDIIYALNYDSNGYTPIKVTSRESLVRWMDEDQFGHTLFTTREEAEQAIKEKE